METNEQGLTKEEKIMFIILSIILIVALGVLVINSLSSNERQLEDNQTPITENEGQKENVKDEVNNSEADSSLIEDTSVESVLNNTNININPPSQNLENEVVIPEETPVIPEEPTVEPIQPDNNDGTGSVEPTIINWFLKDTIVTEAYTNDLIIVEKNILLEDGSEKEASVIIKKVEGETFTEVDISSNTFIAAEGTYIYYYTYENETKEIELLVKNYLEHTTLDFLALNETYIENSTISEEEFSKIKNTIVNSKITSLERIYTLSIINNENNSNLVPLILTFNEELSTTNIISNTPGVTISLDNELWYQELIKNDIILWLDINTIDLTNNEIIISIDNINYSLKINILIEEPKVEDSESNGNEENNGENIENSDNQNTEDTEDEDKEEGKIEEQEEESENLPGDEPKPSDEDEVSNNDNSSINLDEEQDILENENIEKSIDNESQIKHE